MTATGASDLNTAKAVPMPVLVGTYALLDFAHCGPRQRRRHHVGG
jgi:hypothetical protein